jgi:hypothetical protein
MEGCERMLEEQRLRRKEENSKEILWHVVELKDAEHWQE